MSKISFEAEVTSVGDWSIIHLPQAVSAQLPSRGMTMVAGTINGAAFQAPLEPDGKKGHWLKLDTSLQKAAKAIPNKTISLTIEPTKDWPEPHIPNDVQAALKSDATADSVWQDITPMARWDWLRWVGSTKNEQTRQRRIEVMCSKMRAGSRRPCCFNRTECTDPNISKNGVLLGLI